MERKYHFAGIDVLISIQDDLECGDEQRLKAFATNSVIQPHVFVFNKVKVLPPPEGVCKAVNEKIRVYQNDEVCLRYYGSVSQNWESAHMRVEDKERFHQVQLLDTIHRGRIGTNSILSALGVEHLITRNKGFVFHCSYIEYNGKAILFTAPSETGKSTQAELWHNYRGAQIINGDRAAVRMANGTILAEGIPFAGSSTYCRNRSLPVAAIVYLAQAPETTIRNVRGYEAFSKVWEGISVNTWDLQDMELASELVKIIAEQIPVYYMPCTPDESAVITLERELRKRV